MILRIPRRSCQCASCKKTFIPGNPYFSRLSLKEEEAFRQDFCESCWNKESQAKASHWRGVVGSKIEEAQKCDRELKLLHQEIHAKAIRRLQDDTASLSEKYLLALYLQREKKLYLQRKGNDELHFIDRTTKACFVVKKAELSSNDLLMREALYNLFNHETIPA